MTGITTHVLDTSVGKPAADVVVELSRRAADGFWELIATGCTNADGRVSEWHQLSEMVGDMPPSSVAPGSMPPGSMPPSSIAPSSIPPTGAQRGVYRLSFAVAAYFAGRGSASFFPEVQVVFEIVDANRHYHVPLLLSPYGYSTYRGS